MVNAQFVSKIQRKDRVDANVSLISYLIKDSVSHLSQATPLDLEDLMAIDVDVPIY
jgi:hypothetical protein